MNCLYCHHHQVAFYYQMQVLVIVIVSVDYTDTSDENICDLACADSCHCQLCVCCTVCSDQCKCSSAISDMNEKMEHILGFGDENYRSELNLYNRQSS